MGRRRDRVAAVLAFLVRTPLKLALVDLRRNRSLDRTRLAGRIAVAELLVVAVLAVVALASAGWNWLVPVALAAPLIATELWFDIRSRGRRLVPEVSGSIGIAAVAAAIVVAADEPPRLATAIWLILAARAIASIPFVRTQIMRLRRGSVPLAMTDAFQVAGAVVAAAAVAVETSVVVGAVGVVLLAAVQTWWTRQQFVPPAKVLGLRQMAFGIAVVIATAVGVLTMS